VTWALMMVLLYVFTVYMETRWGQEKRNQTKLENWTKFDLTTLDHFDGKKQVESKPKFVYKWFRPWWEAPFLSMLVLTGAYCFAQHKWWNAVKPKIVEPEVAIVHIDQWPTAMQSSLIAGVSNPNLTVNLVGPDRFPHLQFDAPSTMPSIKLDLPTTWPSIEVHTSSESSTATPIVYKQPQTSISIQNNRIENNPPPPAVAKRFHLLKLGLFGLEICDISFPMKIEPPPKPTSEHK
jgi:hypothetical protein